jgi:hypothetical protein
MLSTSNKTKFQYQYLLVAVLILAMVSVIALYKSGILPAISIGQSSTQNLTTLSAADVLAYRWDAIARFYAGQESAAANLSWPARPDFSILNAKTLIPVTGNVDGLAVYHSSEWAAPAAGQNGMTIYHQSERNAAQVSAFHYTSPGR